MLGVISAWKLCFESTNVACLNAPPRMKRALIYLGADEQPSRASVPFAPLRGTSEMEYRTMKRRMKNVCEGFCSCSGCIYYGGDSIYTYTGSHIFLKGGVRIDTTQRSIVRGTWCLCGVVSLLRINFTVDDGENHIFILPKSMKG